MLVSCAKYIAATATLITMLTSCMGSSSTPPTTNTTALGSGAARLTSDAKHSQHCPCLYVAIPYSPTYPAGAITVYRLGTFGDVAPIQTIGGSATELHTPSDVVVDSSRNIFVADYGHNAVMVYAAGANGNVAPIQTIIGSKTQLDAPFGIALDPVNDDIYIANRKGNAGKGSLTIYAHNANGNVAPIGSIAGSKTQLDIPTSLAIDPSGNIYVPNLGRSQKSSSVTVYAAGSSGNVKPIATISGSNTGLNGPYQVTLDSKLNMYVANFWPPYSVTVYAAGANGNVAPIRTIQGKAPKFEEPDGVTLDSKNDLYVANYTGNSIATFAPGANGNVKPTHEIAGKKTGVVCPSGMTIF